MLGFRKESPIDASPRQLWQWHMSPGAFEALAPPWQHVEILQQPDQLEEGAILVMKVYVIGPLGKKWVAKHRDFIDGRQFVDEQLTGPFRSWVHTHLFLPADPDLPDDQGTSILRDMVDYELPLGAPGELLGKAVAGRMLDKMFAYRHDVTAAALESAGASAS